MSLYIFTHLYTDTKNIKSVMRKIVVRDKVDVIKALQFVRSSREEVAEKCLEVAWMSCSNVDCQTFLFLRIIIPLTDKRINLKDDNIATMAMFSFESDPLYLLKNTKLITLCKTCVEHMTASTQSFSQPILAFGLKALGIFLSLENVFSTIQEENVLLPLLATAYKKGFSCYSPSVQAALLFCLQQISHHKLGMSWILSIHGIFHIIFRSFFASSFYIRRDSWQLLSSILISIYHDEKEHARCDMHMIQNSLEDLLLKHIFPALRMHANPLVQDCAVSMLKMIITETSYLQYLLCTKYKLICGLRDYFRSVPRGSNLSENMLSLFVECYTPIRDESTIDYVRELLISKSLVSPAINLCVALVKRKYANQSLNILEPIAIVLAPLYLSIETRIDNSPNVERLNLRLLNSSMKSSEGWMDCVLTAIVHSMYLIPCMSHEVISHFVLIICEFLNCRFKDKISVCSSLHKSAKLKRCMIDLVLVIVQCETFKTLNTVLHLKLLHGLMFLEGSLADHWMSSSSLKVIRQLINAVDIDILCLKEMEELIQKKLSSSDWCVVDSGLEILHCIVKKCKEDYTEWIELICSNFIYECLWNFVVNKRVDSYVKATSIDILCSLGFTPFLWKKYTLKYEIEHDNFIQELVKYVKDGDIIVQRAAMNALCRWIESFKIYDTDCASIAFKLLEIVISKSFDWDSRMSAVKVWRSIAETVLLNAEPSENSIVTARNTIQLLDEYGFCSSLFLATKDEDVSVKKSALSVFLELQEKFSVMGISEDSLTFEPTDQSEVVESSHSSEEQMDVQEHYSSKEDSDSVIHEILHCNTSELIFRRLIVNEIKEHLGRVEVLSSDDTCKRAPCFQFWKTLWSDDLQSKLTFCDQSSDVNSNNPINLLDDILSAVSCSVIDNNPEYLQADCY